MSRIISQDEEQENRLRCKGCRFRVAFLHADIRANEHGDRYISCPSCSHINVLQFHNDDPRNVIDEYKHLPNEEIKRRLQEKALPYAILMSQVEYDFNISSIIRSANFNGCQHIFYYGHKRFDKRGAAGTYHYSNVKYLTTIDDIKQLKEKYAFVALENNIAHTQNIRTFNWPENSLIVVGSESRGLQEDKEVFDLCDYFVEIENFGSVRSLNAGAAAVIAMYDYLTKS